LVNANTIAMYRIVLVDDHAIVREGFRRLITRLSDVEVVGEAASRLDALPLITAAAPDLVITDLTLADGSGMRLLKDLATHHPYIHAIVLSMHDNPAFVAEALSHGAKGYVTKAAASEELLEAVQAVLQGRRFLSRDVQTATRNPANPVDQLTRRERDTLALLVRGLVPKAAAAELGISEKTLYAHRASLLDKLGARNDRDLARIAVERGLI
jgi:two-component system uhpT operon response regulator UhpA